MKAMGKLLNRYVDEMPTGTVTWIGVRPAHKAPMESLDATLAVEASGLDGDHRRQKTLGSARQITLISQEFIQQIEHYLPNNPSISPEQLRRNLVIQGMNLNAVRHQCLRIGECVILTTALCHPCARMTTELGEGAIPAMIGHGGLCGKILQTGIIRVGDAVTVLPEGSY